MRKLSVQRGSPGQGHTALGRKRVRSGGLGMAERKDDEPVLDGAASQ